MEYTSLGTSGPQVSRIALGCMSFGTPFPGMSWTLDDDGAQPFFQQALDLGVTFWDTANAYGGGTSEEIVGRAIKKYTTRDQIVLATKQFWPMHEGPTGGGLSRAAIFEQTDASLRRLDTDYIDLMQIHRFDPTVPAEETMEALHDVIQAGKVRYIGASSMWAWQFAKMQSVAELNGWTKFVSMQDQYSLTQREEEREMFGLLADQGVGSIPWSPLNGGTNARPWGDQSTTRAQQSPKVDMYGNLLYLDTDKAIIDATEKIAADRGVPMAQVALAWVLHNPVVASVLSGATKPHHLADAVAALDITLTDDELSALQEPYRPRTPTYFQSDEKSQAADGKRLPCAGPVRPDGSDWQYLDSPSLPPAPGCCPENTEPVTEGRSFMSTTQDSGPVAVITGASSGIGAATARALAAAGYRVALLARRLDRTEALATEIGNGAIAFQADITDRDAVVRAAQRVQEELGGVDVLVNNAGIMLLGPFSSQQSSDYRSMIEVNLLGAITATEVFLDQLKDGGGDLINISSVAGRTARAGNGVYAATKWGLNGWSESLRQELLPDVRVTLIEPGIVDTELPRHIIHEETRQAVQQSYDVALVKPEEIAEVIAFILARPRHLVINEVLIRPAGQLG